MTYILELVAKSFILVTDIYFTCIIIGLPKLFRKDFYEVGKNKKINAVIQSLKNREIGT